MEDLDPAGLGRLEIYLELNQFLLSREIMYLMNIFQEIEVIGIGINMVLIEN
jgi:hypothetical protein